MKYSQKPGIQELKERNKFKKQNITGNII